MNNAGTPAGASGRATTPQPRRLHLSRAGVMTLALLAWVGAWWIVAYFDVLPFFPTPPEVVERLWADSSNLWHDTLTTMGRAYLGFVLGSAAGVLIPLVLAASRPTQSVLGPLVEVVRTVPGITLLPLFLVWFGSGDLTAILLVSTGSALIMVVVAAQAIRNVPPILVWAGTALGANRLATYRRVVLPSIVPGIIGGLRVTLAASVPWAIAGEYLGAQSGLGYYLWHALPYSEVDRMMCVVLLSTVVVVIGDAILGLLMSRATRWTTRKTET